MKMILYILVIRSIIYVMLCTILDVSTTLSITSIYQSILGEDHWNIVKNVTKKN
jgi:hypothetical protein